ncbi:MAG TPA: ABC transporter ATP-binding protein [bacterium]|nr:ABC transporter ATP-binding protein [bacterium]
MIRVTNLAKRLGDKDILRGVNLDIHKGETMVILGRSGEGKSVLLKHFVRLMKPDSGQVFIEGQEITHLRPSELVPVRVKVGMLFQGAALFDSMTIEENVGFALYEHSGLSKQEIRSRVIQELAHVQLTSQVMNKKPAELSGGMKKRVGLARAIIIRPNIMLYDEPTTGLDPITADAIDELIIQMQRDLGITSVVVTHDMKSAFKVADRMALLNKGRIHKVGSKEEFQNTDDPMVRQFILGQARGPMT